MSDKSKYVTLCGMFVIMAPLFLCAFMPEISIGIALGVGVVLGIPLLILGMRLDRDSSTTATGPGRFLPASTEMWGIALFITIFASVVIPVVVVLGGAALLPSGDSWGIVAIRLTFAGLVLAGIWLWIKFTPTTVAEWFRGKVADETLKHFTDDGPADDPTNVVAAAYRNWQLPVIAVVSFCVAFRIIDVDNPWLEIDAGPRRARLLMRAIEWCRGNPNSVFSSSVLVGVGASALFIVRVLRAVKKPNPE